MIYCVYDGVAQKPVVSFSAQNDEDAKRFVKHSFSSSSAEAISGLMLFQLGDFYFDGSVQFDGNFFWVCDLKVLLSAQDQLSVNVIQIVKDQFLPTLTEFERRISGMAANIERLQLAVPARWFEKSQKRKQSPLNL